MLKGMVEMLLDAYVDYVNTVVKYVYQMDILKVSLEGEQLRCEIERLDHRRHDAHEAAIASCTALNRLSLSLGLPEFAPIDTSDRHQVADFAGQFVLELYFGEIGGMEKAVEFSGGKPYAKK